MSLLSKVDLRASALERRAAVTKDIAALFGQKLATDGLAFVLQRRPGTIGLYWPIGSEADPRALTEALARHQLNIALPITRGRGQPLDFRAWQPGDPQTMGQMAILEPARHLPLCMPDILFVPLAAFDRRGHRIGYGAGHYDCTLAMLRTQKPIIAVGVAFATQEIAKVPAQPHDQRLDFVVTEREWMACPPL